MAVVHLSEDLSQSLQTIAKQKGFFLPQLVESILAQYILTKKDDVAYEPEPEELATLLEAVAEYEEQEAAGTLISQAEMNLMLANMLIKYEQNYQNKSRGEQV